MERAKVLVPLQDGRDLEVKSKVFSPCVDSLGAEYHSVIYTARHPMMKDAPLRVHGMGTTRALAHAAARNNFAHAYDRLTQQAGRRTQHTQMVELDTAPIEGSEYV